jgi:hypothetical protein
MLLIPGLYAADKPVSFRLDVMPVFFRAGCKDAMARQSARTASGYRYLATIPRATTSA